MRLLVAVIFLLLGACAPAQALEVSNFRAGLACTNTSTRDEATGWICHVTEDVLVTDQGQCRYNGKDYFCTWVGFEFDYRGAQSGDQLECTMEQSRPTALGNPREELDPEATSQKFVLPLEKSEGHFYNPQYFTFTARPPGAALLISTGRCSFEGKDVFEYTYRLRSQSAGPGPNNSFKPNLLRYTKHMAGKACHVFGSTTQVGLTQALDRFAMTDSISTIRKSPITLYVLALQDGCYYVGQSCHFLSRVDEHFSGKGSAWTRVHPPVAVLCARTIRTRDWKTAERFENRLTLFLMAKYGWQHVRGGFWSNVSATSTVRNLQHHCKDRLLVGAV